MANEMKIHHPVYYPIIMVKYVLYILCPLLQILARFSDLFSDYFSLLQPARILPTQAQDFVINVLILEFKSYTFYTHTCETRANAICLNFPNSQDYPQGNV